MKKQVDGLRKVFLVDDLAPEDLAMIQALYSRSADSVEDHLKKVTEVGSGKFMASHYVGYGHKSIADGASTTLFLENVSLLAAKAIQDWPLYCGQETSTRYIDMSTRAVEDPVGTPESAAIQKNWMDFYLRSLPRVQKHIEAKYPRRPEEKEETYARAVKARVFDTLRGFLPAGIHTQLSWHTNLRQAGDHLLGLSHHPAEEIRGLSQSIRSVLAEAYPSSGMGMSLPSVSGVRQSEGALAREEWDKKIAAAYTYIAPKYTSAFSTTISMQSMWDLEGLLQERPKGCILPHSLSALGQLQFSMLLDFGSFRDIQRHRNGVCVMPMLTTEWGFHEWYLDELDAASREEALMLLKTQEKAIAGVSDDPVVRQYYTALGYKVSCQVTYGLPAAIYVLELRSSKTVHPTLRRAIHKMVDDFTSYYVEVNVPLHVDLDVDDWDVRRGSQTITAR